jgi:hypothetical protein
MLFAPAAASQCGGDQILNRCKFSVRVFGTSAVSGQVNIEIRCLATVTTPVHLVKAGNVLPRLQIGLG